MAIVALLSDIVRSCYRFQSNILRRPASAYAVSHSFGQCRYPVTRLGLVRWYISCDSGREDRFGDVAGYNIASRKAVANIYLAKNRYNQEKAFYYLLMKYRSEHLENYPGNEPATRKPSDRSAADRNQQQRSNSTSHRPQTRGKGYTIGPNESTEDCHCSQGSRLHPQTDHSGDSQARYAHDQYPQRQHSKPYLRAVASRSSLAASVRYGMSSSPSGYRSVRPSRSYKRHVNFKHHNSRNARSDKHMLTVRNNTDKGAGVDAEYREDLDREDSPKFEHPEAALPPRSRRESATIAKRRSTVVIDGLVLDGGYAGVAQSFNKKMSFMREKEDAERRRIASRELEEVCEKAFNGSVVRSSFATLSTVKSTGYTANESINTIQANTFSDDMTCSSHGNTQSPSQSLYAFSPSRTESNLPSDALIGEQSQDRNTLRIFQDGENNPDKGCLDDVIEHLDRLMDSSSRLRSIDQLRAVSHAGIPLNLGRSPLGSRDTPAMVRQYLDQEERDHQRYLVARATLRNVSAPNPHKILTLDHQSKQLVPANTVFRPASLIVRPKSDLRSPMDETPRSETRNTIRAVNEALRFDVPMPTPELRHPVDQKENRNDRLRVVDDGNWDSRFVGAREPVTINAANEPKKKRSFMNIFTGKKVPKADKGKDKSGDEKNPKALGTPGGHTTCTHPSVDELNIEKGTFGRRSGNVLRRFVSRDAKRELYDAKNELGVENGSNMALNSMTGKMIPSSVVCFDFVLLTFGVDGGNPLASCFSPGGYLSDEDFSPGLESQDEFARVMGQRNWFQRVLNVKPASRIIHCSISALQFRREILKLYREWLKYGLVIVEDDRKGLVLRARVGSPNSEFLVFHLGFLVWPGLM